MHTQLFCHFNCHGNYIFGFFIKIPEKTHIDLDLIKIKVLQNV